MPRICLEPVQRSARLEFVETSALCGCQSQVEANKPAMPRSWLHILLLTTLAVPRLMGAAFGEEASSAPAAKTMQELVFGNGTPGPFSLSWTEVRFGSEL